MERHSNLTDQHALLLESSMQESQLLREELARKEEQHRQVLSALNSKIDALTEKISTPKPRGSVKRKRSNTSVPKQCRNDFRKIYKQLLEAPEFNGFDLSAWEGSRENNLVCSRVVSAIYHDYGGENKCPWSNQDLKGASATYFKSLRDGQKRAQNGQCEMHRRKCRRQGRLREKVEHRLVGLDRVTWQDNTKEEVRAVLIPEYTSSDESVYSEDEDSGKEFVSCYLVKHLPWERNRLTSVKKTLDDAYMASLNKRIRNAVLPRSRHPQDSRRPAPDSPQSWAVRTSANCLMPSTPGDSDVENNSPQLVTSTPRLNQSRASSTPLCRPPAPAARQRPTVRRGLRSPTY